MPQLLGLGNSDNLMTSYCKKFVLYYVLFVELVSVTTRFLLPLEDMFSSKYLVNKINS